MNEINKTSIYIYNSMNEINKTSIKYGCKKTGEVGEWGEFLRGGEERWVSFMYFIVDNKISLLSIRYNEIGARVDIMRLVPV